MSNKCIAKIKLNNIEKIELYVNSNHKTMSAIKKATGADYIMNAGFFNGNWTPVPLLKANGKMLSSTPWTDWGFGWNTNDIVMASDYKSYQNFITGVCLANPWDGTNMKLTYRAEVGGIRGRSAVGLTNDSLVMFCTKDGSSYSMTPEKLRTEMIGLGCSKIVMFDGGGSSQAVFLNDTITSSRIVHNFFLVYLKKKDQPTTSNGNTTIKDTELRKKYVEMAESYLGVKQGSARHKEIVDTYNKITPLPSNYKLKTTDAWCAGFTSAIAQMCGIIDIFPAECSCSRMINRAKGMGIWVENDAYKPNAGDLIMYNWSDNGVGDDTGAPNHVGIVVSVSGNTIKVIEGNKSKAVGYRNIAINGRYIRGFVTPKFSKSVSTSTNVPSVSTGTSSGGRVTKVVSAQYFDKNMAKTYVVKSNASTLNIRKGPGTSYDVIKAVSKGTKLKNYGYYSKNGSKIWLYIQAPDGTVGYVSKDYVS